MGELSASIAHELNRAADRNRYDRGAGLRYLARDEPDVEKASEALKNVVSEAGRAGEIIKNLRAMFKKDNQDKTYSTSTR